LLDGGVEESRCTCSKSSDLPVRYKGKQLDKDFKVDVLVENEIILELKSIEIILPIHEEQLLTYLRLADKRLGLLINFNVELLKHGIRRKINGYD
jgi:GxxExxY protein